MSTFNLGPKKVLRCVECSWVQTSKHFNDGQCSLCGGDGEMLREIDDSGPSFNDKQLLRQVDEVAGVGTTTAQKLRDSFEVEKFIDACRQAYEEADTAQLEQVNGVGGSTASAIADYVGSDKDWEKQTFKLSG